MDSTILHIQSVYNIPNSRIRGHVCRTNLPSNTGFRGFGKPQALFILDSILSQIADRLGMEMACVQEINLLKDGDLLVYGRKVEDCTIRRCWGTLKEKCQYERKKEEVQEFNK